MNRVMEFQPRRCAVIAEVAQAHDGSLGLAHAFIDAAADAGADGVKFQTHIAAAESTPQEPWRIPFSRQDKSRYDYWKRVQFEEPQWRELKEHADKRKLLFLSSPFSIEAVELLERIGVSAWKIASGETGNSNLLQRMAKTRLPFLISTGMSPMEEVDAAVNRVRAEGLPMAVLQCTSLYPTPPERVGLNLLQTFRERYRCPVGLSDHSGQIFAPLAAAALGAQVLEVHITFHRGFFGPDVPASLTIEELMQLVQGVRAIERMHANPVDKDKVARELEDTRRTFTKSIVARTDLPAGRVLREEDLALKKPGTGLPASALPSVLGRKLARKVRADELLKEKDLN